MTPAHESLTMSSIAFVVMVFVLMQTVSHSFPKLSAALLRKFGTDEANRAWAAAMFFALPIGTIVVLDRSQHSSSFRWHFCFKFRTLFATVIMFR